MKKAFKVVAGVVIGLVVLVAGLFVCILATDIDEDTLF